MKLNINLNPAFLPINDALVMLEKVDGRDKLRSRTYLRRAISALQEFVDAIIYEYIDKQNADADKKSIEQHQNFEEKIRKYFSPSPKINDHDKLVLKKICEMQKLRNSFVHSKKIELVGNNVGSDHPTEWGIEIKYSNTYSDKYHYSKLRRNHFTLMPEDGLAAFNIAKEFYTLVCDKFALDVLNNFSIESGKAIPLRSGSINIQFKGKGGLIALIQQCMQTKSLLAETHVILEKPSKDDLNTKPI